MTTQAMTEQQLPVVTAFVSYSHLDREFGHQAKAVLGEVGIDAFLAHEDMETVQRLLSRHSQSTGRILSDSCHMFRAVTFVTTRSPVNFS